MDSHLEAVTDPNFFSKGTQIRVTDCQGPESPNDTRYNDCHMTGWGSRHLEGMYFAKPLLFHGSNFPAKKPSRVCQGRKKMKKTQFRTKQLQLSLYTVPFCPKVQLQQKQHGSCCLLSTWVSRHRSTTPTAPNCSKTKQKSGTPHGSSLKHEIFIYPPWN